MPLLTKEKNLTNKEPYIAMRQLLRYIGWPTVLGLCVGIALVMFQPALRQSFVKQFSQLTSDYRRQPASYANAVKKAAPAVVSIFTQQKHQASVHPLFKDSKFRSSFKRGSLPLEQRKLSEGSGVIVDNNGFILTNHHVIADADSIFIILADSRQALAKLIGSDRETDLAVLKINLPNLTAMELGDPLNTEVGDIALTIGNPFGIGQTVSQGIISATGRYGLGLNTYENYLQTDAAINKGNSGGALIDTEGRLLGINTAIIDQSKVVANGISIGFAIPANMATDIMEEIIETGSVSRGWLGIGASPIDHNIVKEHGLTDARGVYITEIYPDGPADRAGLMLRDIITHINRQRIGSSRDGVNLVGQARPGDKIKISVLRNGSNTDIEATLGSRPTAGL